MRSIVCTVLCDGGLLNALLTSVNSALLAATGKYSISFCWFGVQYFGNVPVKPYASDCSTHHVVEGASAFTAHDWRDRTEGCEYCMRCTESVATFLQSTPSMQGCWDCQACSASFIFLHF